MALCGRRRERLGASQRVAPRGLPSSTMRLARCWAMALLLCARSNFGAANPALPAGLSPPPQSSLEFIEGDTILLVTTMDGGLHAVSGASGDLLWSFKSGGQVASSSFLARLEANMVTGGSRDAHSQPPRQQQQQQQQQQRGQQQQQQYSSEYGRTGDWSTATRPPMEGGHGPMDEDTINASGETSGGASSFSGGAGSSWQQQQQQRRRREAAAAVAGEADADGWIVVDAEDDSGPIPPPQRSGANAHAFSAPPPTHLTSVGSEVIAAAREAGMRFAPPPPPPLPRPIAPPLVAPPSHASAPSAGGVAPPPPPPPPPLPPSPRRPLLPPWLEARGKDVDKDSGAVTPRQQAAAPADGERAEEEEDSLLVVPGLDGQLFVVDENSGDAQPLTDFTIQVSDGLL